jgi:branched-chain amino acid aminotransferase
VVLTDGQGHITEGPGFNVFAVFGTGAEAQVVTPNSGVLEGVSRRTVLEMAREAGCAVQERPLPVAELQGAQEIFLSSTGGGVIPIALLNGVPVAGRAVGEFGPVSSRLRERYWQLHEDPRYTEAVVGLSG